MFVSSEMPEVMGIADRIIVMCDGRITGEMMRRGGDAERDPDVWQHRLRTRWKTGELVEGINDEQQTNGTRLKKLLAIRGMGAALTAFAGLIVIYIAFGMINPAVFSGQNVTEPAPFHVQISVDRYRDRATYLITGNIDLSIGSLVGMSAMISATLMTTGMNPLLAILIARSVLSGNWCSERIIW